MTGPPSAPPPPAAVTPHGRDRQLATQCLAGDAHAWARLRAQFEPPVRHILLRRGASATEAADLLGDLWADCLNRGADGQGELLRKYHGRCGLLTWLATVCTHRLVDLKRRQRFVGDLPPGPEGHGGADGGSGPQTSVPDPFQFVPAPAPDPGAATTDAPLLAIMRRALLQALAELSPEERVMLRLVYLERVPQRVLGRMWNWHESKVSRSLDGAMRQVRNVTLREIHAADPWLELSWKDFLRLCEEGPMEPWFPGERGENLPPSAASFAG